MYLLLFIGLCLEFLAGLVGFIIAGLRPLSGVYCIIDAIDSSSYEWSWETVRMKGLPIIPILLPFYPIWGLAKAIIWLFGLIPWKILRRKPRKPLQIEGFGAIQPAGSPVITESVHFVYRPKPKPSWITLHLFRPAGQSLRWLWQLLVAVKSGACPRIELEDS